MSHDDSGTAVSTKAQAKADLFARITGRSSDELFEEAMDRAIAANFKPLLLVLQMGKVASTSIAHALEEVGAWNVVHIHHLDRGRIDRLSEKNTERGITPPPNLLRSQAVLDWLQTDPEQVQIVSAVRDPVARNLSAFFENAHNFLDIDGGEIRNTPEEIAETFVSTYRQTNALDWFDANIRRVFKLDVFSRDFDHEQKRLVAKNARCRLIVVRAEDDDTVKAKAIARHLRLGNLDLGRTNIADTKSYAAHYERVKAVLRMPEELLDKLYDSKLARHFYTEEEIAGFRAKWGGRADATALTTYPGGEAS
jgi:plasmid stabilization system protein ParE